MATVNRTAICHSCHDEYHRQGASDELIAEWEKKIESYLKLIGTWDEYGRESQ